MRATQVGSSAEFGQLTLQHLCQVGGHLRRHAVPFLASNLSRSGVNRTDKGSTFAVHAFASSDMSRLKNETLSIRTSPDIKQLLRLAAEREHRSVASMIEVLVLTYARENKLDASKSLTPEKN